jgi:hypothetical protein
MATVDLDWHPFNCMAVRVCLTVHSFIIYGMTIHECGVLVSPCIEHVCSNCLLLRVMLMYNL